MYHKAIVSTNFNIGFVKRKSMTVLLTNEHKNSKKKNKICHSSKRLKYSAVFQRSTEYLIFKFLKMKIEFQTN